MSKYSTADRAMLVKALNASFPDTRFTVRRAPTRIDVNWTDGPSYSSVRNVVIGVITAKIAYTRFTTRGFVKAVVDAFCTAHPEYAGTIEIIGPEDNAGVWAAELSLDVAKEIDSLLYRTASKDRHHPYGYQSEHATPHYYDWSTPSPRMKALSHLGLSLNATNDQIMKAFRQKVKAAANGRGGFAEDMDLLVKAKDIALQRL